MSTATQPPLEVLPAESETAPVEKPRRSPARKAGGLQKIESHPPVAATPPTDMEVFAQIASNPNVDETKLEKLIQLKERLLASSAKAEFDAAFSEMQGELPSIDEKGRIVIDGQPSRAYAKNEDIQDAIRPILKRYGFGLTFRQRKSQDGKMEIVGILTHRAGHREEDAFETEADDSGKKNRIQARGSSRSYGQRYTTIFLLNISTRERGFADDDGQASESPEPPKDYEDFVADVEIVAKEGMAGVAEAWKKTAAEYREYAQKHDRQRWSKLRAKAKEVDKSRKAGQR